MQWRFWKIRQIDETHGVSDDDQDHKIREDVAAVFGSQAGLRTLSWLAQVSGFFDHSSLGCPYKDAERQGRRNMVTLIINTASDDQLAVLKSMITDTMQEGLPHATRNARTIDSATHPAGGISRSVSRRNSAEPAINGHAAHIDDTGAYGD